MGRRDWADYLGRPPAAICGHSDTISTITAGLERIVCEKCGNVSVRFVAESVKIFPDVADLGVEITERVEAVQGADEPRRQRRCSRCEAPAVFMIPRGLACAEHAWAAASRQDATGGEIWIPIRIDQNATTSG